MKKILDGLRAAMLLAGIALLVALTAAALELRQAAKEARQDSAQILPKVNQAIESVSAIELNTTRTEAELAGLLNTQRHAVAGEQKVLSDADNLLLRSSQNLDGVFARADEAIQALRDGVQQSAAGVANDSAALSVSLSTITKQVGDQVSNPAIAESLADIRDSAASVKASMADLAASSADVRKAADFELKRITAPVSFAKRAAQFIASLAGKFFNF